MVQAKSRARKLFGGGFAGQSRDGEVGTRFRTLMTVGGLDEEAAGDLLENARERGGSGLDLDEAEILLGGEAGEGFGGEGGSDDGLDEEFGDLLGGGSIDLAVDADDAAEGGDGIGGESAAIGVEDGRAGGGAAGVGVLDDDNGGLV